ncbi:MAG: hypothetical protein FWD99_06675 [Oscillospiraceae bacterium]|nr:hypothetical protein [Oscillospiraceae bacterium]
MQKETHFFLGANAPAGFTSLYAALIDPYTDDTLYIIKGGPGCGKSSFMAQIAQGMAQARLDVEYIHCTADPDSLDAIYIPALKTAYVDGTAPHIIEPLYPAVMEQYLNLGTFYDVDALKPKKMEVMEKYRAYKALYARAYDCIAAAHGVIREVPDYIVDDDVIIAVKKRTKGIISREIGKKRGGVGVITRRFLSALTYQGYVSRFDTVATLATRVYHLDNTLGLAHHMITDLSEAAVVAGLDCILCPSPLNPDRVEHLFIPDLSLAFISSDYLAQYDGPAYRHIRLDAMADGERLRGYKAKLRFLKKIFGILIDESVSTLAEAKAIHDELERLYNPHVDFDGVYQLAGAHVDALLWEGK